MRSWLLSIILMFAGTVYADNPVVLITTNSGEIKLELYPDKAPATVENFLSYVDNGHYNGTIFHRVISNFMIQGGGFTPDLSEKPTGDPIQNESKNHLHNERGTIAMARTDEPDSAAAQFFINVRSNLRLDFDYVSRRPGYAVFGRVIEGMDVVDGISLVKTGPADRFVDVPITPIIIERIERVSES